MAKFGIALGSGPRGLGFKSRHSDQKTVKIVDFGGFHVKKLYFWPFVILPCGQIQKIEGADGVPACSSGDPSAPFNL